MTDLNALAAKAWEDACHGTDAENIATIAAVIAPELDLRDREIAALRLNVKGWVEWHRRCDADDDCNYLNDNAWCDAEALASTGMGLLARTALGASHD